MQAVSRRKRLIGSVFGSIGVGVISIAAAQTAPVTPQAGQPDQKGTGLETITVVARKKSESLQKVPLSITAISKRELQNSRVQTLADIVALTPGVNITDLGSEVGTSITIRGVTDLTFGANIPDVAVFLDGVYLREQAAINVAAAGLAQVEVVKGPVSALYGRDAYSGVINYVTDRPSTVPHANLEYNVGDYGKEEVQASVSGPIWGDKILGKVFGTYDNFDGSYRDDLSGARGGSYEKKDVGGLLDFKWNDNLSTRIDAYYGYDYFGTSAVEGLTPNCGYNAFIKANELYCGRIKSGGNVQIGSDPRAGNPGNERRVFFGSMRNTLSYDWGKIDSITGATRIDEQAFQAFDASSLGLPYQLADIATGATVPNGKSIREHEFYGGASQTGNFSEELRYTSPQDQSLRYGVGGFFYRERRVVISAAGLSTQGVPAGEELATVNPYGIPLSVWETEYGTIGQNINVAHQLTVESSGFGNAEYDILKNLTVSSEYRYTDML